MSRLHHHRPCLPDQDELIVAREKRGIFLVKPGLTGLAQIRGIDMSQPEFLAKTEAEMLADFSVSKYFSYILLTVLGKGAGDFIKK